MNRQIIDILKPQIREKIDRLNANPKTSKSDFQRVLKEIADDYMSNLDVALNEIYADMTNKEGDR